MSLTNGSFNASAVVDPAKGSAGYIAEIAAAVAFSQTLTLPAGRAQQGMTIYNTSGSLLRGTITYAAGTVFAGPAAEQAFLVPPGGVYSVDLSDDGSADFSAIQSVIFETVAAPIPGPFAEASTLAAAAATSAGLLLVNFATD